MSVNGVARIIDAARHGDAIPIRSFARQCEAFFVNNTNSDAEKAAPQVVIDP